MVNRCLLLVLFLMLVSACWAQNFYRRPSPFAGRTQLTLALFEEVQKDLKLTPEETKKIDGLVEKMGGEMQDAFQGGGGDFNAMQGTIEKINAKYDAEIQKALPAEKYARLKQLYVQYNGAYAIMNADISKELAISDDQKAKIKKVQDDQRQKMMDLFQGGGGGSPEEMQGQFKKLQDEEKAALDKVLTDDQRKKLKGMEGVKFEFKKAGE